MFFTRVGYFLAALLFVLSVFRIGMTFLLLWSGNTQEQITRYTGARTSGEVIDQATIALGIAVALGVLCEISKNIREQGEAARIVEDEEDRGT